MPVIKRTREASTRYYVYTRIGGGRKAFHGAFGTRREAEIALNKVKHDKDRGTYREPKAETVASYFEDWLGRKARTGGHRRRTTVYYAASFRDYVKPIIGELRLSDVRPPHIERVVDAIAAGMRGPAKPSTIHRRYRIVAAMFADAVKTDRIPVSPCRGIDLPKLIETKLQPPSPEDVERILAAAPDPYRLPLSLMAWSGVRRGECLGVRWSDVNLSEGFLYVRQAATFVGREVTFDRPKSRGSDRAVPLTPRAVALLRKAKAEQDRRRLAVGQGWRDLDLVVDNGDGRPMHPERLTHAWVKLMDDLGLRAKLHDLRHACITVMLADGVSPAIVAEVAGHASMDFTRRRYGHLQPEHLRAAADAMARTYGEG